MNSRRDFLKSTSLLASGAGMMHVLPASIAKALAIDPVKGSTFMDAEHIVFLMQENRSFDHAYGTLQGVRGFNDPRAITLPDSNPVWLQTNKAGDTYAPFRLNMKETKATWMSSLPHGWRDQVDARNNGKYDKWLDAKPSGHKEYAAMPLTMGYYNREDIPFYYALADAFTVCDHNFCSSLTGTTPNRLYFWSGTIREEQKVEAMARVWNGDADYDNWANWKTFPERLEENNISWKVYQNEISVGVGLEGEEDEWLANFTDNALEFCEQYHVKLAPAYISNLPKQIEKIKMQIKEQESLLPQTSGEEKERIERRLTSLQNALSVSMEDQKKYTKEKYDQLTPFQKNIHEKAFATNKNDPDYHTLTTLKYKDGDVEREVKVPKGDILHQFRSDVQNGKLPTVSWIVAPENYSDHPGAAWYGAWYISEVMDILTQNPEVWKKTIFILTYDENDGYFDHLPPYTAPHIQGTGKVSKNIDTSVEYVTAAQQSSSEKDRRESSIGLGYRVPMVIASPWSRGGWVNSEVFDHTSSLRFLETFLSQKFKKKIEETNISQWRRTVCGDLTSVFRPWNGEKIKMPEPVKKDVFIQSIYNAKFKRLPSAFKQLKKGEIDLVKKQMHGSGLLPEQEKGIRDACALPYELYADGELSDDKKTFRIHLQSSVDAFGKESAGSPFNIYTPVLFQNEPVRAWSYAVAAGDTITDEWNVNDFEQGKYHLQVYGPNGFYREFTGSSNDPSIETSCTYEKAKQDAKKLTGNLVLTIKNKTGTPVKAFIKDNAYKIHAKEVMASGEQSYVFNMAHAFGWYDFSIIIDGVAGFERRYAGHIETGKPGKTDPYMGRVV